MKILHLLSGGGIGGIEILCRDIAGLSTEQHEFCFLYSGGIIADEMKQRGDRVHFLYDKNLFGRICGLVKLVKKEKYDVVIVHHEGVGIYSFYLILTQLFKDIKFVKYLHCSFEEEYFYVGNKLKDRINYAILKKTLKQSNQMIAVSEFVKRTYCEEFQCGEDKIEVIHNGILMEDNALTDIPRVQNDNCIKLLYIGRLVEVKGVRLLLQAVKQMKDSGEAVRLTILGDGPQGNEYIQLSKELGIEKIVDFEGYQLDKQSYYRNADIFIYPSIWQEAFGISIVEALARGMICVASASGGIPEIIDDGIDGYLFERGNVDDLLRALRAAAGICQSGNRESMIKAAGKKASQFTMNKMIQCLERVCAE